MHNALKYSYRTPYILHHDHDREGPSVPFQYLARRERGLGWTFRKNFVCALFLFHSFFRPYNPYYTLTRFLIFNGHPSHHITSMLSHPIKSRPIPSSISLYVPSPSTSPLSSHPIIAHFIQSMKSYLILQGPRVLAIKTLSTTSCAKYTAPNTSSSSLLNSTYVRTHDCF